MVVVDEEDVDEEDDEDDDDEDKEAVDPNDNESRAETYLKINVSIFLNTSSHGFSWIESNSCANCLSSTVFSSRDCVNISDWIFALISEAPHLVVKFHKFQYPSGESDEFHWASISHRRRNKTVSTKLSEFNM